MTTDKDDAAAALADQLAKELNDQGLLIEAGFAALRKMWITPDAPPGQVAEMRLAFFAGAQHLFGSIMGILTEDREPTEADLKQMDQIADELEKFGEELKRMLEP